MTDISPSLQVTSFDPEPLPAKPASPFDGLAAKLAKVREELSIDLEVPRWPELMDLRVVVRYAPIEPSYLNALSEKYRDYKGDDKTALINAQALVKCCRGVYVQAGDKKLAFNAENPDGPWPCFDATLARSLQMPDSPAEGGSAVAVCRALYLTEADLAMAFTAVADWSAQTNDQVEKGFQTP